MSTKSEEVRRLFVDSSGNRSISHATPRCCCLLESLPAVSPVDWYVLLNLVPTSLSVVNYDVDYYHGV